MQEANTPLRIYIDPSGHDYWHRIQFEEMIAPMRNVNCPTAILVDSIYDADCVLRIGGCPSLTDSLSKCLTLPTKRLPPEFTWEMGDLPTGALPGFYVSLPSYMFDHRRHRAFRLPYVCNELIRPFGLNDAKYLYGYCGSTSSGLRSRLNPLLLEAHNRQEALIDIRDPIWNQMFNRGGIEPKVAYAENLRLCKFNLCPRGCVLAGTGSRLYETMQAARVPVIISRWITLPNGVDWDSCSVQINERDISKIPNILKSYSDRWPEMALRARHVYEEHFSNEVLLAELGRQLSSLIASQPNNGLASRVSARSRIMLGVAVVKSLDISSKLQRLRGWTIRNVLARQSQ